MAYQDLHNIALRCKPRPNYSIFALEHATGVIKIDGIVGEQETPQTIDKKETKEIKPANAQQEVLIATCKMVFGGVPECFTKDNKVQALEGLIVRKAQLNEIRR